jgi:hypothetical protein
VLSVTVIEPTVDTKEPMIDPSKSRSIPTRQAPTPRPAAWRHQGQPLHVSRARGEGRGARVDAADAAHGRGGLAPRSAGGLREGHGTGREVCEAYDQ